MKRSLLARLSLALLLGFPLAAGPTTPATVQETASPALGERRSAILSTARRYAHFRWSGSAANAFHGEDEDGVRVDTADDSIDPTGWALDGGESEGMPYCWGGFTSIEQFREGLAQGRYAGLVPTSEHAFSSRFAMGLDCSGFVARCWDLPQKQSTRSLGALSYELAGYDELLPGDILNEFDSHVALFAGFADPERTKVRVIEAARIKVAEAVYDVALLRSRGFVPMRYKLLDARWVPMESLESVFDAGEEREGRFVADGGEVPIAELANPLRGAKAGAWARYDKTESHLEGIPLRSTRLVARADGQRVEVQAIHEQGGKELARGAERDPGAPFFLALVDFAGFVEPLQDLAVVVSTVETGTYELGGRSFPARRIHAIVEGNLLARHQLYPAWTEIDCVQSDAVPLQGILQADYRTEITWQSADDGDRTISQETKTFRLTAFGGG